MQTTSLGNAYGVCVITVTFMTTCMILIVALVVWRLPSYVILPVFLIFIALDGVYMSSVLTKVPAGAWFTIMLSAILSSIFILWRFGKETQWAAESQNRLTQAALLNSTPTSGNPGATLRLASEFQDTPVLTVPGVGIFFDKAGDSSVLPPSFTQFVRKFTCRPAVIIFFHMRPLPVPTVPLVERYVVSRTPGTILKNCYSVVIRHGYTDDVIRPGMASDLFGQIELAISRNIRGSDDSTTSSNIAAELEILQEAALSQTVYILGKEAMRVKEPVGGRRGPSTFIRSMLLELYIWIRENSRGKLADLDIDVDRLVEVGFLQEI
jgi:KUP system potassium uptake protein